MSTFLWITASGCVSVFHTSIPNELLRRFITRADDGAKAMHVQGCFNFVISRFLKIRDFQGFSSLTPSFGAVKMIVVERWSTVLF
jgi:hypothetical protein